MKKPTPLRLILDKTLKALEIDVSLKAHSILGAWNEIVGESLALQTQPRSIRNQILFIDVSHSTWIQQLQFLKPALLEKINAFLGGPYIQDIRFKLGKISPSASTLQKAASWENEKIDPATLKRIEYLIEQIDDAEVRKELQEVLIQGAKLEQFRKK
jgi:predicted nucleic acid-binding Zn ribbon protein